MSTALGLLACPALASASESASHSDPVGPILLALALIPVAAKLGGDLGARLGQPAVLGELVVGVVLGNLQLLGYSWFHAVNPDGSIDMLAQLGVLLLLFEVGLESTASPMLKVGLSSFLVATLGVIAPFALGLGVGAWLLPSTIWHCMPTSGPPCAQQALASPRGSSRTWSRLKPVKPASSSARRSLMTCSG
ncbi:MAG: cation:proton antiporter [Acidobacteria bacterium]|nr:cation:proton antiporter [Acidobacteriota bacterium]